MGYYGPEALIDSAGNALVGALVSISPVGPTPTVDSRGNLTVSGVPGLYTATVTPSGGAAFSFPIRLLPEPADLSVRLDEFYPEDFGAVGNGTTDDTQAIEDALAAASAVDGTVRLANKVYGIEHLDIPNHVRLVGSGVFGVYDTWPGGGNFTPNVAPFLRGSVLKCLSNAQSAAVDISSESATVDLKDFGVTWATPLNSTGHGIRANPGTGKNGLAGSRWDNVQVWGHDGNSYGFHLVNATQWTFTHLRAWGGGLVWFRQLGGSEYGNGTFIGCTGKLFAGGTAHGSYLSGDKDFTRITFVGCEFNGVNFRARPAFSEFTFNNPTSAQQLFRADTAFLRGLSLLGVAFDVADTALAQPTFPTPPSTGYGGVYLDPGGFHNVPSPTSLLAVSAPRGGGVIPLTVNNVTTLTASTTLTVRSASTVVLGDATTAPITITLPSAASSAGRTFTIKKADSTANAVTVATAGGNIDGASTRALSAQYAAVTLVSSGSNWFVTSAGG